MHHARRTRGYTMVEVLIVVAIVGILLAIVGSAVYAGVVNGRAAP